MLYFCTCVLFQLSLITFYFNGCDFVTLTSSHYRSCSPGATMQQKLTSKLAAAEERRRDLGEQMNQKFAERDNRIKEVRKRKATSNAEMA